MTRGVYYRSPELISRLTNQVKSLRRVRKHSIDTLKKMSIAQMGNQNSLGAKRSAESCAKISLALKGRPSHLKGKILSAEVRFNMSIAQRKRAKQHAIYNRNIRVRRSLKYALTREKVFKRDDYTCQTLDCRQRGGRLNMHHIKSFSKYPHLRFVMTNLVTLCVPCHKKTDNFMHKAYKV